MYWLLHTVGGFWVVFCVLIFGGFGIPLWITLPTKADIERRAAEKLAKQEKENREREPKRLL